jgi:membrane peptidoglycan carboxypeptidase
VQAHGNDHASPLWNALLLLVTGSVAGGLVAALALPAVGGAGMSVKAANDALAIRPEQIEEPPLPELTLLLDANGKQIAQFYYENRQSVALDKVAPVMRDAIIAVEDYRFYQHGALDIEGTVRALAKNLTSGGVTQGGSSITQQYVKQVLFNKAETDEEKRAAVAPTFSRKLNELRYALAIEEKYTKDEILERYLNIAYFGASAYGVQAAAKRFFGKPASDLALHEAATLAGAVQNPIRTDPNLGKESRARLLERRNLVLDQMVKYGKITPEQAAEAKKKKLGYKDTKIGGGCESSKYPYFCLYVQYEILNNPEFGKNADERRNWLQRGGLTIKTTIDPKMQAAADKAIKRYVRASDKPVASQAIVVPGTGEIRAMAASRKFGGNKKKNEMSYNVVSDILHGGGAGFQAGSTFKPFTLATALEQGMKFDDGFDSPGGYRAAGYSTFRNCKGERVGDPTHTVNNASGEGGAGFKSLVTGTLGSVNTFFMKLEEKVGLCETVKMAKKLGIKRADGKKLQEFETFTLGINEMDPVTVASAYAVFAARGSYCTPMAITQIIDREGKATKYKPKCKQVLDEEVADAVSHIMSGVFTKGTMAGVGGIGRAAAGKTGTTDDYRSAWFAGYTPDLASAVSLGDPRGSVKHPLRGVTIGGTYYGQVFGSSISGRIWKDSMIDAHKGIRASSFTPANMARFGGCSSFCAPKPKKKDRDERGDDRGDERGGRDDQGNGPPVADGPFGDFGNN